MKRSDLLICLLLGGLTLIEFAPARSFSFINYDDPDYVTAPYVERGFSLEGVAWAFTTNRLANWHPITWLSLMLDAELYGGVNPAGFHFTNIVLHAANTVLVFLLLLTLTRSSALSCLTALLFAFHPFRVQSVAWVSERKGLLSACFCLLSLLSYVRFARRRTPLSYAAAFLALMLALLSKPIAVTLPFVMLLLDVWPLARTTKWSVLLFEKLPFFVLVLAGSVATYLAQQQGGAMSPGSFPLGLRVANAICAYVRYLQMTVWPRGFVVFHPFEGMIQGTALGAGRIAICLFVILTLTTVAILVWQRTKAPLIGWLWFVGVLAPSIGIVQVGLQSMADRYTYLPHVGLFAGVVFGLAAFCGSRPRLAKPLFGAALLGVLVLAAITRYELRFWSDNFALYDRAIEVTRNNHVAHKNLAFALADEARLDDAISHLRAVIAIRPEDAHGQMALANLLEETGRLDEAINLYERSIQLAPQWYQNRFNYGVVLGRHGRQREAIPHLKLAVQLAPEYADAHFAYALALGAAGDGPLAAAEMQIARRLSAEQGDRSLVVRIDALVPAATNPATALPKPPSAPDNGSAR